MTLSQRAVARVSPRAVAEDRYLSPGWPTRLDTIDDLLATRTALIAAYRDGRIRPDDLNLIADRVEWIDARIGQLSRNAVVQRSTGLGRIRTTGMVAAGLAVALGVLFLVEAPNELLTLTMVAIAATIIATIWAWVTAPEPGPHDADDLAER